ncbi:FAD-linked oxidase C-terminal domain-containing protein [Streptomyces sp. DSM 42041]|uniref:FAD-linked oxidase C-terminal domain-containing protein n=1 Tax=Streptomyces hazeniae TaxID=3075538 RepID=A0ABU2NZG9_9ACTN|nr:FAD-linked oxidase C-terminal domain-containing protein [Streptomyces sp. DSM 42041]MDT0382379.1 FAD-linked oxidase C-terminal domain-containing protein [Streptomyces sp. DSM 42041]
MTAHTERAAGRATPPSERTDTAAAGDGRTGALADALAALVGREHVRVEPGQLAAYARDATPLFHAPPDVVVFPGSTEEVAAVLRLATERGVPVIPRGAGSNLCAGTVALHGGVMLVLTRLNRVLEISPGELLARVQTGVTTAQLADAAGDAGLLYAPDPGSRTVSTVGGNVATCAGGLRGLKYGVTRNYVLGLEAVLPTGEIVRTGGRLWKDVAGYDLTRLLTGSEGTLAVITEVTVALLPKPADTGTGVAYFDSLADASRAVAAVIAAGVVPATLEFLDRKCIEAVEAFAGLGLRTDAGALLLFGDDGDPSVVAGNLARIQQVCTAAGALEVTLAENVARADALLAARRCGLPALSRLGSLTILEDATVPRHRLAEMVGRIDEIAERHGLLIATFGHAGDGNLHPTCVLDPDDTGAVERAHQAFGEIFAAALALDGTITGEHGVGAAKLPYLADRLGDDQMALLRRIKHAFDPAGILNPGKLGS